MSEKQLSEKILITKNFPDTAYPPDVARWLRSRAKRGIVTDPKNRFDEAYIFSCACRVAAPQYGLGGCFEMILTRDIARTALIAPAKLGYWHLLVGIKTIQGYVVNPNEYEFWKLKVFGQYARKVKPITFGEDVKDLELATLKHFGLPVADWDDSDDPCVTLVGL